MSNPFFEPRFPEYAETEMNVFGPLMLSDISSYDLEYAYSLFEMGFVDENISASDRKDARAELIGGMNDSNNFFHRYGYLDILNEEYDAHASFAWHEWREEYNGER